MQLKHGLKKIQINLKQISFFNGGSVSAFINLNTDIILYCACNVQINFRVFRHTIINFRSSIFRFTCRDSDKMFNDVMRIILTMLMAN